MRLRSIFLVALMALGPASVLAQTPPAPAAATPAPAEAAPATPTPATPAAPAAPANDQAAQPVPSSPPAAPAQPQAPATAQPATPAAPIPAPVTAGRSTLFPNPGDPTNVDEGVLVSKPTVMIEGKSTWDDGFANLKSAFVRIEDELKKAGIAPTGRPLTVFLHTDDDGFRYQAMVPIAQVPEGRSELTPEIKFAKTPEGKTFRFVHEDAYDEIDGTYETITAYLDAKDIVSKDVFVEEYVTDLTESSDANLRVNIYVQPKD